MCWRILEKAIVFSDEKMLKNYFKIRKERGNRRKKANSTHSFNSFGEKKKNENCCFNRLFPKQTEMRRKTGQDR